MKNRNGILLAASLSLLLTMAGCGGGGSRSTLPTPAAAAPVPAEITLSGVVSDGPVEGGWIYAFNAADINAVLSAANAAEDRKAELDASAPITVLERQEAHEDGFQLMVPGGLAGGVVFVVFDGTDAQDEEFGDTPSSLEAVVVLGDPDTRQRVNLSLHATLISQQVRAVLDPDGDGTPIDQNTIEAEIVAAEMNVLDALGEGVDGEPLYPDGESPLDSEDNELVHDASSLVGLLARTIAALEDVSLDAVVAALAADAADGEIDGGIPAPFEPSDEQQALADAADELLSRGEDDDIEMMANGPCSSSAVALWQACDIDILDDYFEGRAICADISDAETRTECIAEIENDEECDEVFDARIELCEELDDAAHEPAFGPAFAGNFVDPLLIGKGVTPNPYLPLVQGNTWTYEGTSVDDDGEEVTEIISVTVTADTKLIQGITCLVVNDVVEEDGEVIESTDDWFAQDVEGNVWYCGEISENFETFEGDDPEEPELVDIEGSWKAGREGAKAGMLIPFSPEPADVIRQELAHGEAEDVVEIVSLTATESAPAASCTDTCLHTIDSSPLEPDAEEDKYYVPGIGLIVESGPETGERVELIDFTTP